MLGVMYGVSAMIPITFGVAGYALVSRDPSVTLQRSITAKSTLTDRIRKD